MRETCDAVDVGGRVVRYALLRAPSPTADTVLFDPGGPGVAALSGQLGLGAARASLGDVGRRHNVLVLEEPWVRRAVTPSCRRALAAFYRSARGGYVPIARARLVATVCEVGAEPRQWGYSAATFRDAIGAITRKDGLVLRGVVAMSFGAVRWQWLAESPAAHAVRWVVLVRPFPVGVRGSELISARAAAVSRRIAPREPVPLTGAHTVATRAIPVTRFDQLSAMVELAYHDDRATKAALGDVVRVAELSDALWQRYGADDLSPAYLAYLDELCSAVSGWPGAEPVDSVRGVLVAAHLPCAGPTGQPLPARAPDRATCVVVSPHDAVTPYRLVRRTYAGSQYVRFVRSAGKRHGSFDGLATCLASTAA